MLRNSYEGVDKIQRNRRTIYQGWLTVVPNSCRSPSPDLSPDTGVESPGCSGVPLGVIRQHVHSQNAMYDRKLDNRIVRATYSNNMFPAGLCRSFRAMLANFQIEPRISMAFVIRSTASKAKLAERSAQRFDLTSARTMVRT